MNPRRPTLVRSLSVLLGLALFAAGLILLATVGRAEREAPATEGETLFQNGTARQAFALPGVNFGEIETTYNFPVHPGNVELLSCNDWERVARGEPARDSLLRRDNVTQGSFRFQLDTVFFPMFYHAEPRIHHTPGTPTPPLAPLFTPCSQLLVVFGWTYSGNETPTANQPAAQVTLHINAADPTASYFFVILSVAGAVAVLIGILLPARSGPTIPPRPDQGTAEALLEAAEHTMGWMRRTQRYLRLAGFLGVFLWYPILIPLSYSWADKLPPGSVPPGFVAFVTFLFLLALSAFWLTEHRRLSRDIRDWEARIAALRARDLAMLQLEPTPG